jgi:hypothetical protein
MLFGDVRRNGGTANEQTLELAADPWLTAR